MVKGELDTNKTIRNMKKELELKDYYKPLGNGVIVKKEVNNTKGGIILPEQCVNHDGEWLILATGDACKSIKIGDTAIIRGSAMPYEVEIANEKYMQFYEHDILGIVDVKVRPNNAKNKHVETLIK